MPQTTKQFLADFGQTTFAQSSLDFLVAKTASEIPVSRIVWAKLRHTREPTNRAHQRNQSIVSICLANTCIHVVLGYVVCMGGGRNVSMGMLHVCSISSGISFHQKIQIKPKRNEQTNP